MERRPHIHIVCSDQTRNGKSLLTRLLADFLVLQGGDPFVADLDAPEGEVCEFYPERSEVFDIARVSGQMELFDWILASPERDYILDVPARHLDRLFAAMDDIGFVDGAHEAGFDVVVFYIVEGDERSLARAKYIRDDYPVDRFVAVRHAAMEAALRDIPRLTAFNDIATQGQIVLPLMPASLRKVVDRPGFSFRKFIEGRAVVMSDAAQLELATFLEAVVDDIQKVKRRMDVGNLSAVR